MLKIKNKIEFENNLFVGEVDASLANSCQEERIKFVTDIASITYGRLGMKEIDEDNHIYPIHAVGENIQRRNKLYNKLLTEATGKASSPFEFIPVVIDDLYIENIFLSKYGMSDKTILNKIYKYSYCSKLDEFGVTALLTNMRTLLNAGIKEKDIPFNTPEEVKEFKVIIGKLPKIAYDHLITHRSLSRIAESSRNKKYLNEVEYYENINGFESTLRDFTSLLHTRLNQYTKEGLKAEDATKELSCRRLMLSAWAGWKQDENTWNNLFKQREVNHTQSITKIVVENIKILMT